MLAIAAQQDLHKNYRVSRKNPWERELQIAAGNFGDRSVARNIVSLSIGCV
jgi:hypothetical protein